jgi:hypothetical protein
MAREPDFISRWGHLFENVQTPSSGFYRSVEAAVQRRAVPDAHWSQIQHKEAGLGSANRDYFRIHRGKYAFDICAAPFGTGFFVSWWFTEPPLPYGILYTLGFLLGLVIAMNIAFAVGGAIGATMQGVFLATLFGGMFAFIGVPAILWLLGNGMRQGKIGGESTVLAMPLVGTIYEWIFAPATYYAIDTALTFQDAIHNALMEVIDCLTAEKGVRALTEAERKPIMKKFGPKV